MEFVSFLSLDSNGVVFEKLIFFFLISDKRRATKLPTSFILMQMELYIHTHTHTHIKVMFLKGKNILIKFRHD